MVIEKKQIQQIQTIMHKRFADRDERLDFISAEVARPIKSTKDLSAVEADELIYYLNTGKKQPANWAFFDKSKFIKQRKYLLSLLHQAQWVTDNESHGNVPDLVRLSSFIKSPKSPVQKPLKQWDTNEWQTMIFVFEQIVKGTF
ncbi:hypothetical protein OEG92_05370 [Polaribacter sejongensis]|uniref:hypothetical protein n=1 Tax=Polaribacter sejongensis TaxID=985043 RepID=UPI0035A57761